MTYRSWTDLAIQGRGILEVPDLGPTYGTGKVIPEGLNRSMGWKSWPAWLLVAGSPGGARMTSSLCEFKCCPNHLCDLTLRTSAMQMKI